MADFVNDTFNDRFFTETYSVWIQSTQNPVNFKLYFLIYSFKYHIIC